MREKIVDMLAVVFFSSVVWLIIIVAFGSGKLAEFAQFVLSLLFFLALLGAVGVIVREKVISIHGKLKQWLAPKTFTVTTEERR